MLYYRRSLSLDGHPLVSLDEYNSRPNHENPDFLSLDGHLLVSLGRLSLDFLEFEVSHNNEQNGFFRYLRLCFVMDLRSIALFRVSLACVLLCDLLVRCRDLTVFYSDQGILPRALAIQHFQDGPSFSFHMLSGHWLFQAFLFGLAGLAALGLLVGVRTRLMAFLSWLFLLSVQVRNPLLLDAGDGILLLVVFWSMFLPLGARASVDLQLSNRRHSVQEISTAGSLAYMLQLLCIYWFSVLLKSGPAWHSELTAVYYALHAHMLTTPVAVYLRQFEAILPWLTRLTLLTETIAPFLFFVPSWGGRLRLLGVFALLGMHFSFQLCLNLGIFSIIPLVALLPLLPSVFWDHFGKLLSWRPFLFLQELGGATLSLCVSLHRALCPKAPPCAVQLALRGWQNACVIAALCVVLWANLASVWTPMPKPKALKELHIFLQLTQNWGMFAPQPPKAFSWFAFPGELADGSYIDLYKFQHNRHQAPTLDWKRNNISRTVKNYRWGNFTTELWDEDVPKKGSVYWPRYVRHLCGLWNKDKEPASKKRLLGIALYIMVGENLPKSKTKFLGKHEFFAGRCPDGKSIR